MEYGSSGTNCSYKSLILFLKTVKACVALFLIGSGTKSRNLFQKRLILLLNLFVGTIGFCNLLLSKSCVFRCFIGNILPRLAGVLKSIRSTGAGTGLGAFNISRNAGLRYVWMYFIPCSLARALNCLTFIAGISIYYIYIYYFFLLGFGRGHC